MIHGGTATWWDPLHMRPDTGRKLKWRNGYVNRAYNWKEAIHGGSNKWRELIHSGTYTWRYVLQGIPDT